MNLTAKIVYKTKKAPIEEALSFLFLNSISF